MIFLAAAIAASIASAPAHAPIALPPMVRTAHAHDPSKSRQQRRFHEILQDVQYDGDYSPSATREPEPEVTPTTPVRYLPAWKKLIPVRVPPAKRYVDPAPANGSTTNPDQQKQQPQQQFVTTTVVPATDVLTSGQQRAPGGGSATGSTAVANYGQELPTTPAAGTAGTTVQKTGGTTTIQVTQPSK